MLYCRFQGSDGPRYGLVEMRDGVLWMTAAMSSPLSSHSTHNATQEFHPWGGTASDFEPHPLTELTLLAPVEPTKIICVGRNYRDHAKELGNEIPAEPLLFWKPPSSLLAPGGVIRLPRVSNRVDFEGEFAVIIARRARNLRRTDDLAGYIHGYTLANDVTARDLQKKDGQWTRAKGMDTFCPVGPVVETLTVETGPGASLDSPRPHTEDQPTPSTGILPDFTIETRVNGELRQSGSTADFIFSLPVLLEYITETITLEPGDLVLTGTPAGVGPLAAGDVVEISLLRRGSEPGSRDATLPALGTLSNSVAAQED
jgi:2-keto-4-pentenoate hydratase/2-oxohepta-3-ene-1,7-dioic acid hydratase in catechol pathway